MAKKKKQKDADVVAWFKSQGDNWEDHINAVLRAYVFTR